MIKYIKNNKGVTIIELLVSILLLMIVLSLIYSFFIFSVNFGKLNTDKADGQAQSRLISQGLQKEVATSALLVIATSDSPSDVQGLMQPGEYAYFIHEGSYSRMDYSGNIEVAFGNLDLESLNVTYTKVENNLLKVTISGNGFLLENEIYSPNVSINVVAGAETKNVIIIKSSV